MGDDAFAHASQYRRWMRTPAQIKASRSALMQTDLDKTITEIDRLSRLLQVITEIRVCFCHQFGFKRIFSIRHLHMHDVILFIRTAMLFMSTSNMRTLQFETSHLESFLS